MKPLYPLMAVVVIASAGALPLRARANDGETHPVNALAKILAENSAARDNAGSRIEEFLLTEVNGKSFVRTGEKDGNVDKVALGAVARDWAKAKDNEGRVANLYFVIGPGKQQPAWVTKDTPLLVASFIPNNKWESRLRAALERWTDKTKAQITKAEEKKNTTAFLNEASDKAATVYSDARSKKELDLDIESRNDPVVTPDTRNRSRGGSQFDGGTRQYTLEDLYQEGAAFGTVAGPKDEGGRKISIKIYSTRGEDGTIYNEIGIFDITDNSDIYGRRFPLNAQTQSFALDDRTPGHRKYELTFGAADGTGNRTIKLARPGGGAAIETTVTDLLKKRADQAERMGNIVKVGDQEFYTIPQGGAKSALAFFPKSMIDTRENYGDPRNLVPALYAETGKRGPDGRNQNFPAGANGGPHLGKVGDKAYHLEWSADAKAWVIKEGAGDIDKPKPPTPPGGGTGPGTDPSNPGGGTPTGPTPEGGMSIADLEKLLLQTPGCKKNPDDVKDLADNLKGKYGIVSCTNDIDGLQQIILTPKTAENPGQQLRYGNITSNGQTFKILRARFVSHYLVLVFDKQTQYLDLLKQENGGFALSGFVADKNASKFEDVVIFVDALRHYMGITAGSADAGSFDAVPTRLRNAVGNKAYRLTGAFANGTLIVNVSSGGETFMIWPTVSRGGQADARPNPYENINGPATAMDSSQGSVSSANDPFPEEQAMPESRKIKRVSSTADIALYETVDVAGQSEPKKYYIMFKYKALDPKDPSKPEGEKEEKIFRQKQFEVFNSTSPKPDGLQLQGLIAAGDPVIKKRLDAAFRYLPGSTKEKGAVIVVQNKALSGPSQQDAAANCVGPIAWWGMDRPKALEACQKDKL